MEYHIKSQAYGALVNINGKFTFTDNERFRSLLNSLLEQIPAKVVIDLEEVTYIDSAALGMLLLLRERMDEEKIALELCSPRGQVKQLFDLSKFDSLFTILP